MQHVDSDNYSSDYEAIFQDDFTYINSFSDTEKILNSDSDEENKLLYLTKMRYSEAEALIAIERCGLDSSIAELTDFICVAQMAKAADALLLIEDRKPLCNDPNYKKSAILTEKIRKTFEAYDDDPPSSVQKYVLDECRKWNLVRVGRNKVVPLEPDEVEMLLEVAFYCLGMHLKANVQELNDDQLEQLMIRIGEFDLVQSSEGHNGYNPVKENDHHGKDSNDVSRLEPAS
ncbi:hypothetical protein F3Y22_tig00000916pilonHSYRG00137 [Hibiscus syriacus]|uniref:DNA (Cytosine-5)-methyltransferase DRM1/2 n=1 Tax=Hibiscus syriacus TaxID=106335 RepID=A0A6A3CWB6_HIBSY|nr:hypothetical protein F3Y22_tig00000916pilonHSYRG00137 [Hibiscus syriacus]